MAQSGPRAATISSEPDGPPLTLNQMIADMAITPSTRLCSGGGRSGVASLRWWALAGAAAFLAVGSASELWDAPMSGVVNAVKPMVAATRLRSRVVTHEGSAIVA